MTESTRGPLNPYPGLRPFREDEEHLFFGRENQVDAMVDKLAKKRFLAVVGTSGSGKSSLVNCGLRPALRRGLMASAGTAWRMAQFRPGNDPIGAMARALAQDGVLFGSFAAEGLSLAEIVETTLRMSKVGLIDIVEQAALGDDGNVLVVVDQFEELFRYRQLASAGDPGGYGMSEDASALVNLLLEVKERVTCPIFIVLTMRSDFLGDCTQFPGLAEAINAGQYLVPRMTRDERRAAIACPARVAGAEIAPVLMTRLVNDVGDNPDQLSILQHALNRTWAHWESDGANGPLALAHYEAIGTMAHALDAHAEKAYGEMGTARQQHLCEKLFKALTDKATDPRGIRRPTTLGTLCVLTDATAAEVAEIIDVFRKPNRSFLMPPAGDALSEATVIDISHESLMRVWERLKVWANEEAQSARTYRRLAETAELHALGNANLWRDPELQLALDWCDRNHPNETWGARYHPGFGAAMAFLKESSEARDAERLEEQQRHQRELDAEHEKAEAEAKSARRMRWTAMICAACAFVALGFGLMAYDAYDVAEKSGKDKQRILDEAWDWQANILFQEVHKNALNMSRQILLVLEIVQEKSDEQEGVEKRVAKNALALLSNRTSSLRELKVLGHYAGSILDVAATDRGVLIVTGSDEKDASQVWDADTGALLNTIGRGTGVLVTAAAVSQDGSHIVTGYADGSVRVWDVVSGSAARTFLGHTERVTAIAVTPDGARIVTGSDDGTVRIWDANSGDGHPSLDSHAVAVNAVAVAADGTRIAIGLGDGTVRVWDATSGREPRTLKDLSSSVTAVAIKSDGTRIVTGSDDGTARIWDAGSGEELQEFKGDRASITAAAVAPDGTRIAIGLGDGTVRVWDANDSTKRDTFVGHSEGVTALAVMSNESRIVTASRDGTARIWRLHPLERAEKSIPDSEDELETAVDDAKRLVPRCLTIDERKELILRPSPPGWCIDLNKYPYDTQLWKDWMAGREATDSTIANDYADFADRTLKNGGTASTALEAAELSIKFDPQPKKIWLTINLAHAHMLLGQVELAREEYLAHRGEKLEILNEMPWETAILNDFNDMRDRGRANPLMDEIEREFGPH